MLKNTLLNCNHECKIHIRCWTSDKHTNFYLYRVSIYGIFSKKMTFMGELYGVGCEPFEENWLLLVNYKCLFVLKISGKIIITGPHCMFSSFDICTYWSLADSYTIGNKGVECKIHIRCWTSDKHTNFYLYRVSIYGIFSKKMTFMGELYGVGCEPFEENWLLLVNYKCLFVLKISGKIIITGPHCMFSSFDICTYWSLADSYTIGNKGVVTTSIICQTLI